MNLRLNMIIAATFCAAPIYCYALFCPSNFTQIQIGDTIQQVEQQCGKPDKQEIKEGDSNAPQEWSYYIPQTVSTNTTMQEQGTLKTSITFDASGKAINISVNGIGVGSTTICGNTTVQLGDTRDQVKAACGAPSFINTQEQKSTSTSTETNKIVIDTYNTNPPAILIFKNGKLLEMKQSSNP